MNGYNQSPFANITPVVKNLLIINFIFFLATYTTRYVGFDMVRWLSAFYFNSPNFHPWQVVSYMFMHASLGHIFSNMFALFMFGPILEYTLGSKRFLEFYFITGIGALVLQMLVQAIEVHSVLGSFTVAGADPNLSLSAAGLAKVQEIYQGPVLGASGAVFGVLLAFGYLFPNMEMMVLFIPVPVKAKYLVAGYIVWELVFGLGQFQGDSVAHFAHLGGALFGYIILKIWRIQRPNSFY